MVQITRNDSSETDGPAPHRDQLLYSKSKVYVHPTAYARDNIPGFVALTKRVSRASAASPRVCRGADVALCSMQDGLNPTYLLAWIPETLIDAKGPGEWDKFTKIESKTAVEDDGLQQALLHSSHTLTLPLRHRSCRLARPWRILCLLCAAVVRLQSRRSPSEPVVMV